MLLVLFSCLFGFFSKENKVDPCKKLLGRVFWVDFLVLVCKCRSWSIISWSVDKLSLGYLERHDFDCIDKVIKISRNYDINSFAFSVQAALFRIAISAEKYFLYTSFFIVTLNIACRQMKGKRIGYNKNGELLNSHHQCLPGDELIAVAKITTVNIHTAFSTIQALALNICAWK